MRIGAYQFRVTGDPDINFEHIKQGIEEAAKAGVRLLAFPECAVTGYPPYCINSASDIDSEAVERIHEKISDLAATHDMFLIVGTIFWDDSRCFNAAIAFSPDRGRDVYRKRALWGWDRDNFSEGHDTGVFTVDGLKVGIRICFEVRFPEYFRELYQEQTDLNIILFFDTSDHEHPERYSLIKGHIQTRAVENVCHTLTCNTGAPCQTAPTGMFDRSGKVLAELEAGKEGLLVYDLDPAPLNFGESGRKEISDRLCRQRTL